MTDPHKPTNPLLGQQRSLGSAPPFITIKETGEQVPTEIYAYCAWLNAKERRRGTWSVIKDSDKPDAPRRIDWREEVASDGWLREQGLVPKIGRAA